MTLTVTGELQGFSCLRPEEMLLYNGGETELKIPRWMKVLSPIGLISLVNENWDDIKNGLKDGWNLK